MIILYSTHRHLSSLILISELFTILCSWRYTVITQWVILLLSTGYGSLCSIGLCSLHAHHIDDACTGTGARMLAVVTRLAVGDALSSLQQTGSLSLNWQAENGEYHLQSCNSREIIVMKGAVSGGLYRGWIQLYTDKKKKVNTQRTASIKEIKGWNMFGFPNNKIGNKSNWVVSLHVSLVIMYCH